MIINFILLALGIIALFLAFKLLKSIIKAAFVAVFLILILIGIGFLAGYIDFQKIKTNNTYVVIEDDEQPLLYLKAEKPDLSNFMTSDVPNSTNITKIIIPMKYLENHIPDEMEFQDQKVSKEDVINGIRQGNPLSGTIALVYYFKENSFKEIFKALSNDTITIEPKLMTVDWYKKLARGEPEQAS